MVKGDNMKLKKRYLYSIIEMIVVIVVTICVFKFVVIPVRIDGTSMENTLHDQSIALINGIGIKAENINVMQTDWPGIMSDFIEKYI